MKKKHWITIGVVVAVAMLTVVAIDEFLHCPECVYYFLALTD